MNRDHEQNTITAESIQGRLEAFEAAREALDRVCLATEQVVRARTGISGSWFEALRWIDRSGGFLPMGELAGRVHLTSGGVTRLTDRMTEAGLVERRHCPEDRRVQYVAMTDRGRQVLDEAVIAYRTELESRFGDRVRADELSTVASIVRRLAAPSA